MPTVSVKLADAIKARVDRLAADQGTTPHALMVAAIEAEVDRQERRSGFVEAALRSHAEMISTGKAYDGDEYIAYSRARLRGSQARRPKPRPINDLLKKSK